MACGQAGGERAWNRLNAQSHQGQGGLGHLRAGESVLLVKFLRQVGALAELALNAQGLDPVRNPRTRQGMGPLRPHAANPLVIPDGHQPAAGLDGGSDRFEIDAVDERVVDDGGLNAEARQLPTGLDCLAQQGAGAHEDDVALLPSFVAGERVQYAAVGSVDATVATNASRSSTSKPM